MKTESNREYDRAVKAAEVIREKCGEAEIGLILGSGLAETMSLENQTVIDYRDIPGFPCSTVPGHINEWVSGTIGGRRICMMKGRFHYYEGYEGADIMLPVRVMKLLGVKILIVTNASGGINLDYNPGDLVLITDHINFAGNNPLTGPNEDRFGDRFPGMYHVYEPELGKVAHECACEHGIELKEGVYALMKGPSYETAAEIRMLRVLGADLVGMSTVPEVIAARHCGIQVLGISCVTNMAAGILDQPLTHKEVLETGERVKEKFSKLVTSIIENIR